VQRLAAKRPPGLRVEVVRREVDDPALRRRLVLLLAGLLDDAEHSGSR
jgi:hypothetical protein